MSILIYKQRHRHPNYKKTPKGNYAHIGYIATRPGAVKNEGMRHGLFGKLEPGAVKEFDTWQEAARLVRELSYVKAELDAFVAFLKENNEYIRNLVQDYAESKTRLAMLYDTDPAHIREQQEKAVAEADKLIANKILDVIRTMLCKDREVQSFEYTEARKAYFTEQMICEILIALEQTAMSLDMEYDDRQKAMSTDLSKAARKEWYLRHKDKGMEP